jgi:lipopolysaccharide/colanic/teichoic acid biosynthesis glycosyltransferase
MSENPHRLHLYFNSFKGRWAAYGESAFALLLYVKSEGLDCTSSYSEEFQLFCADICAEVVDAMRHGLKILNEIPGLHIAFEIPARIAFTNTDYLIWLDGQYRAKDCGKHKLEVKTLVTNLLPRGKFIHDGMNALSSLSKRGFDIVLSIVTLILFSPLMLICYLAIKIDDGGPAIFAQERVGRFGRTFNIYKFRTMYTSAPKNLPTHLLQNAGSFITPVGRFLRTSSLDELPQLWNILKGDMSIVGPRPPLPREVAEYGPYELQRLLVTPGLTCYWQVQPKRNELSFDQWVALDVKYIEESSFLTDWKLIFMTVGAVLGMNGV